MADPIQLEQVLANLVSNAIKFRRPDDPLRVHVGARRTGGFWEFSVTDNGIGIEAEYFDRIFVIFQRLHAKETYPGTGIGLAIVKRIIDRHGGAIRVESRPGEGSTFFFTCRLHDAVAVRRAPGRSTSSMTIRSPGRAGRSTRRARGDTGSRSGDSRCS